MERICSQCHAVLGANNNADWCPACGGALIDRPELAWNWSETLPHAALPNAIEHRGPASLKTLPNAVDHRGIVLPRRHAVGGVITPQ